MTEETYKLPCGHFDTETPVKEYCRACIEEITKESLDHEFEMMRRKIRAMCGRGWTADRVYEQLWGTLPTVKGPEEER